MPEFYLTPSSISYLALFILASIITLYLVDRTIRHGWRSSLQKDGVLLVIFTCITLLSLLFFLEYSLLPADRVYPFFLENTIVAILLMALLQFAYSFPAPDDKQKTERRVSLIISGAYLLWELGYAIKQFHVLGTIGKVLFRTDLMQYAMICGFIWVVIAFASNAVRNWKVPAVRNFALIMLIPMGLALLTITNNVTPAATYLYPVSLSVGLLLTLFLFALNYLSSQPEQVSFIVKISGAVLTSVLALFGTLPWLVTSAYANHYVSPVMELDHRTIHFRPDGQGGYLVEEIPFQWKSDFGDPVVFPNVNDGVDHEFDFPFLGQSYDTISIYRKGYIVIGDALGVYPAPVPILYPLNADIHTGGPPPKSGVFLRKGTGKVVVTWYNMPPNFPSTSQDDGTYTFQAVLFDDGSFDFTYNGLPEFKFYADSPPDATVQVIGLKPEKMPTGTSNFTQVPMRIGPDGALQDEYRFFRIYLHEFLQPIAGMVIVGSFVFLIGAALVLNYGLARPLNALLEGVQHFDKGRRDIVIPIQSNDEIGYLTNSFNKVGGELNELIHTLENRVDERTQELADANHQLRMEMEARVVAQAQLLEQQRAVAALAERERLARDLHDGIGQVLGFINVQAQSAKDSVQNGDKQAATQLLKRLVDVAQDAHDDVRGYILGLKEKPATHLCEDFLPLLEQYCQDLLDKFGFQTHLYLPEQRPLNIASREVETQLLYVIREALGNACVHSGEKEAQVTIILDEKQVQAVIEDGGIGFHARNGPERRKAGHFGLRIMRERAEGVGGSLEIKSAPGSGTRVTVILPRQPRVESTPGRRILLVDDHPLFLEGMANLLAGRGMSVVGTACDGLEAQAKVRELHPEMILMDIEMPRCDGLEATRRIKAEMPDVKVVMLTVSGDERHLFEALLSGASGYLLKSLDAAELSSLLDELLRGEVSLSPGLAAKMLDAFTRHKLPLIQTPGVHPAKDPDPGYLNERQMETLRLVARGMSYKVVAEQLGVSEVTIKYRMGEILTRLHLNSKREAVQYFKGGKLKQ